MAFVEPVQLSARGIALVPLSLDHETGLRDAAADGALWNIRVTSVPEPEQTRNYIENALLMREAGSRLRRLLQQVQFQCLNRIPNWQQTSMPNMVQVQQNKSLGNNNHGKSI